MHRHKCFVADILTDTTKGPAGRNGSRPPKSLTQNPPTLEYWPFMRNTVLNRHPRIRYVHEGLNRHPRDLNR